MLTRLQVHDFALVDDLELEFGAGLTIFTGETGAGKSILIEALGLALGKRAESGMVRQNCKRADITAIFDVSGNEAALGWLREHELELDRECFLRRTISSEGRSRAYINGRPVPLQMLCGLGRRLVDIHGQHEQQSLLRRDFQRLALDNYARHPDLLNEMARAFQHLQQLKASLAEVEQACAGQDDQTALLAYQVNELEALGLTAEELPALEEEHRRLANAETLIATIGQGLQQLDEDEASITSRLARLLAALESMRDHDTALGAITGTLADALVQIQEAAGDLRHHLDGLRLDPQRLREIEQRLATLHDLARKHHVRVEELPELATRLAERLTRLENAGQERQKLLQQIQEAEEACRRHARTLSESRAAAARALGGEITAHVRKLGLPDGEIIIQVRPLAEGRLNAAGMDEVEFLVCTNPGLPPRPLNKVASGGELSRISLAIHVVTGQRGGIPTMIFDEVDVGIGGRVAEIVGQALRALSTCHQVLCITHLPQVAAQGTHHLLVSKQSSKRATTVSIRILDGERRHEEIARMLGGVEITEQTRAHAGEMLARAQEA